MSTCFRATRLLDIVTNHQPIPFNLSHTVELAMIMDRLYGGVCYAGIDTDPELKYPKASALAQS